MNEGRTNPNQGALVQLARRLGGSSRGQCFVAAAVVALFLGLAWQAWHHPDLASVILAACLAVYGCRAAWRILPIATATRERWRREEKTAEDCPACQYRGFLWYGIGALGAMFWRKGIAASFETYEFAGAARLYRHRLHQPCGLPPLHPQGASRELSTKVKAKENASWRKVALLRSPATVPALYVYPAQH